MRTQITDSNILESITGQFENVEAIRSKLFKVHDIELSAPMIPNFDGVVETPDTKIIYSSQGKFLGHVGRVYESIQPETFLDSVVGTIEGCDSNLDLSGMTYKEISNGKIINFRLPLGQIGFKNILGKDDVSDMFLDFTTGFGGKFKTQLSLFMYRLICSNGMKALKTETELSVKHTIKMNQKVLLYCGEVMQTVAKLQESKTMWSEMAKAEIDSNTVEQFARKIADIKKDEKIAELSTRKANIFNSINEAIAQEFKDTGATVWGLLNGATRYTNHFASGHDNEDFILVNSGAKINEKAQVLAMELMN